MASETKDPDVATWIGEVRTTRLRWGGVLEPGGGETFITVNVWHYHTDEDADLDPLPSTVELAGKNHSEGSYTIHRRGRYGRMCQIGKADLLNNGLTAAELGLYQAARTKLNAEDARRTVVMPWPPSPAMQTIAESDYQRRQRTIDAMFSGPNAARNASAVMGVGRV